MPRAQLSEPLLPQVRGNGSGQKPRDDLKAMKKKSMSYPFSQAEVLSEEVSSCLAPLHLRSSLAIDTPCLISHQLSSSSSHLRRPRQVKEWPQPVLDWRTWRSRCPGCFWAHRPPRPRAQPDTSARGQRRWWCRQRAQAGSKSPASWQRHSSGPASLACHMPCACRAGLACCSSSPPRASPPTPPRCWYGRSRRSTSASFASRAGRARSSASWRRTTTWRRRYAYWRSNSVAWQSRLAKPLPVLTS